MLTDHEKSLVQNEVPWEPEQEISIVLFELPRVPVALGTLFGIEAPGKWTFRNKLFDTLSFHEAREAAELAAQYYVRRALKWGVKNPLFMMQNIDRAMEWRLWWRKQRIAQRQGIGK